MILQGLFCSCKGHCRHCRTTVTDLAHVLLQAWMPICKGSTEVHCKGKLAHVKRSCLIFHSVNSAAYLMLVSMQAGEWASMRLWTSRWYLPPMPSE